MSVLDRLDELDRRLGLDLLLPYVVWGIAIGGAVAAPFSAAHGDWAQALLYLLAGISLLTIRRRRR